MRGALPVAAAPRGTESVTSRRARHLTETGRCLPRQKTAPGASNRTEEPKMSKPIRRALKLKIAERGVVLQVLRRDHTEWSREQLERELVDVERSILDAALAKLAIEGAVILDGERVRASRCARYLDELELISI
jgi:hypothetical protein